MVMRLSLAAGSGGVLPKGDDDVVAEGLELAAGVAGLAAAVGVPGVPVRSKILVAGGGVVEQVPDDDQDGPADGAAGFLAPASAGAGGQASEPLAEEGVGGGVGGQDGDPLGVGPLPLLGQGRGPDLWPGPGSLRQLGPPARVDGDQPGADRGVQPPPAGWRGCGAASPRWPGGRAPSRRG